MKASRYVDDESRKTYNYLTREIKRVARKCKEQWIIDKCEEVEQASQHGNSHKIFRTIKELCGKFPDNIQCVKDIQGNIIQDKQGIFKRWKEHFETLYMVGQKKLDHF